MQYTYTVVEVAALWIGLDPAEIRKRMETADVAGHEAEYAVALRKAAGQDFDDEIEWLERRDICGKCHQNQSCPEWKLGMTEDGDERRTLLCPHDFSSPPSETPPSARVVSKPFLTFRLVPEPGEFSDYPMFEQRLGWLCNALAANDLPGSIESIRAADLRNWMSENFPCERPAFLFPDMAGLQEKLAHITAERDALLEELAKVKKQQEKEGKWPPATYLNIIGTLLAVLRTNHKYGSDDSIHSAMWEFFGGEQLCPRGLGKTTLEGVFSSAKQKIKEANAVKWAAAFPRSPNKS